MPVQLGAQAVGLVHDWFTAPWCSAVLLDLAHPTLITCGT